MNRKKITEKEIIGLLERKGLERPSDGLTDRLIDGVAKSRAGRTVQGGRLERYLGRSIIGFLLLVCSWYLYELNAFYTAPLVFVSISFLVLGVWTAIWMLRTMMSRDHPYPR